MASSTTQKAGLVIGIVLFVLMKLLPTSMPEQAQAVLAVTLLIACWWITEALPIAVTSLTVLILLPLSGGLPLQNTGAAFGHPIVFLFLGGFLIALALEKWNLHQRIALNIIRMIGQSPSRIILGFMLSGALLSMWISNSASAMMMTPIGVAVIQAIIPKERQGMGIESSFGKALMLGIAYSCSIGGLATLVGTPTNAILAGIVRSMYGLEITFAAWFTIGFPIALILLLLCWLYLVYVAFPIRQLQTDFDDFREKVLQLSPISVPEKRVLAVFSLVALAWISRSYVLALIFPAIDDAMTGIMGAVLLFLLPAQRGSESKLLAWEDTKQLPWGVLLLFGGGLALADGFKVSGLAEWLGAQLSVLEFMPVFVLLLVTIFLVNFLTEITSNVATATLMLPITASMATAMGFSPYGIMIATCMASSCAFMLPVATPPNAVVFSGGHIQIRDMIKAGFAMNLISILLLTMVFYFFGEKLDGLF